MNRHYWIYFGAITLLLLLSCKEDQPRPRDSGSLNSTSHVTDAKNEKDPFADTLFLDSLLHRLLDLQNAVVAAPKKPEPMQRLIASSQDTVAACLYIVGQANTVQDSTGEINDFKMKRVAKTAAQQ
jgi:hypothetical protein